MKKKFTILLALAGLMALNSCQKNDSNLVVQDDPENVVNSNPKSGEIIPGQFIIVLNESNLKFTVKPEASYAERVQEVRETAEQILRENTADEYEVEHTYAQTMKAFSVKMSDADASVMKNQRDVKYILPDRMFIMRPPWENPDPDPDPTGQETPYGISRVGSASGMGKTAWIIDTGIDLDHPDLNVDQTRGKNFIKTTALPDDDNGHGSHCAGIVAAIDNEIGVVGVAAGATVVPVKVLDRKGSGAYSVILAGIDYVAAIASPGDAANMSLGGGVYEPIDDAVYAASQQGIYFALAAGNESTDANTKSPARVNGPNIFTISAMDINDNWAYFSNYGNPPIDYCEPGVNIYSTYKKGGYTSMSGTSMAAPHMCGILLITGGNPGADGTVNGDPDGTPDTIGVL